MQKRNRREDWVQQRNEGWRQPLGRVVAAMTLFLTATGLSIYLLPFSTLNQHAVLVHSVIGVLWAIPFCVYMFRHVRAYWQYPLTHIGLPAR